MKPIISPWLIYLIDLFDDLRELFGIASILLGCAAVVLSIIWLLSSMDYRQDEKPIVTCKKVFKEISYLALC